VGAGFFVGNGISWAMFTKGDNLNIYLYQFCFRCVFDDTVVEYLQNSFYAGLSPFSPSVSPRTGKYGYII
jgi:hypothetical protein